ncbi:uncharacterized protein LOC110447195 [Mizuhopecten yessoensis]|uniref:uncharacterized protein LOC110447195 n=1 Tax=Mizuhopecten yessoensis TaxID=6573 RepID=UPI000B45818A|nr:uncharacterized protein LOC110447195 [Mizuhopecten yessoensis]
MEGHTPFKDIFEMLEERTDDSIACRTSDLHKAATLGDIDLLKRCIEEENADVNLPDDAGNTPLCMATQNSHGAVVDILLQHGAAVNAIEDGPLLRVRDVSIAKTLVRAGGDLEIRDEQENTPLHSAVMRSDQDVINYFIEIGADLNAQNVQGLSPLHEACKHQTDNLICDVIARLLKDGALVNMKDKAGKTPLHHACECSDMYTSIAIIVKHGGMLDDQDRKGYCPVHYMIETFIPTDTFTEEDFVGKLDCLLTNSKTMNLSTVTGQSALHIATSEGLCVVIKHLVQRGCDVRCQDGRGKGLLHVASGKESRNSVNTIQTLISCGCDVDCCDFWGCTPLHEAVANGNPDIAQVLVDNAADIESRDCNGASVLHIAAANCSDAVPFLLGKGASVNATDKYLSTPLHFSAWADSWSATQSLIDHGADQKMKDVLGCIPRDTAVLRCAEVISILESGDENKGSSIKTFSAYANDLLSADEFNCLLEKDDKIARSVQDIGQFCDSVIQTPGVGCVMFEDEARDIQNAVEEVAQHISKKLAELDPNFKATLLRAGSSSEGTKTRYPDEYDFMFCLEEFSEKTYPTFQEEDTPTFVSQSTAGTDATATIGERLGNIPLTTITANIADYVMIHVKDEVNTGTVLDLTVGDSRQIPCYLMYDVFSQLLKKILLSSSFPKHPNLLIQEVTVEPALSLQWRGSRYKILDINVDLVPAIRLPCWPEQIRRDYKLVTPDILMIPGMAVSKTPTNASEELWRSSMSLQETAIFRKLKPRVRNSYTTAKSLLNSSVVCPLGSVEETEDTALLRQSPYVTTLSDSEEVTFIATAGDVVPSYYLKMMFLFALEDKVEREGLESVYDTDTLNEKAQHVFHGKNEANSERAVRDVDPESPSPPIKRKRLGYVYGPAEERNVQTIERDIDIDLIRDIYRRCEACLLEDKIPSFFNPKQDVIGSKRETYGVEMALNYVRFINALLDD